MVQIALSRLACVRTELVRDLVMALQKACLASLVVAVIVLLSVSQRQCFSLPTQILSGVSNVVEVVPTLNR